MYTAHAEAKNGTPAELHIDISDLQRACTHATPTTCLMLLQRCQALVAARWDATLAVLPAALRRLVHLRHRLEHSGTFEKEEEDQKSADALVAALRQHACSHALRPSRAGQLRLSVPEATELCQVTYPTLFSVLFCSEGCSPNCVSSLLQDHCKVCWERCP